MQFRSLRTISISLFIATAILSSCSNPANSLPQPTMTPLSEPQTTISAATPGPSPETKPATHLVVWLPDQVLERNSPLMLELIQKQTAIFSSKHPDITVDIRIKSSIGSSLLLDTLQNTSLAAPASLPDLILLNREEMEVAALKGLLIPFDGATDILAANDWMEPIRQLATIQGSTFGIPVASDALVYLSPAGEKKTQPPLTEGKPILCFLNDPKAFLPLSIYLASGGSLIDEIGNPALDKAAFLSDLQQLKNARDTGALPSWVMDISEPADVYRYFSSGRGNRMAAWYGETAESILSVSELSQFTDSTGNPATLVRGWFWAMTQPDNSQRIVSVELAETLAEESFLAELQQTARLLPVRQSPKVLENPSLVAQAEIVATGRPIPDGLFLVTLSPIFQDAIRQIYTGLSTPEEIVDLEMTQLNRP